MEWISVKDKLPKDRQTVDIWFKCYRVPDCWYCQEEEKFYNDEYGCYHSSDVTHWQPLPKPPKD